MNCAHRVRWRLVFRHVLALATICRTYVAGSCAGCPAGQMLVECGGGSAGSCQPCEDGTFKAAGGVGVCELCTECGDGQVAAAECNATRDTECTTADVCSCAAGYYALGCTESSAGSKSCTQCTTWTYKSTSGTGLCTGCEGCPDEQVRAGCGGVNAGHCGQPVTAHFTASLVLDLVSFAQKAAEYKGLVADRFGVAQKWVHIDDVVRESRSEDRGVILVKTKAVTTATQAETISLDHADLLEFARLGFTIDSITTPFFEPGNFSTRLQATNSFPVHRFRANSNTFEFELVMKEHFLFSWDSQPIISWTDTDAWLSVMLVQDPYRMRIHGVPTNEHKGTHQIEVTASRSKGEEQVSQILTVKITVEEDRWVETTAGILVLTFVSMVPGCSCIGVLARHFLRNKGGNQGLIPSSDEVELGVTRNSLRNQDAEEELRDQDAVEVFRGQDELRDQDAVEELTDRAQRGAQIGVVPVK